MFVQAHAERDAKEADRKARSLDPDNDFQLERMRFQNELGYWMNDNLYQFAVTRTEQAESYEQNEIKNFIDRMNKQEVTIKTQALQLDQYEIIVDDYRDVSKQQGFLITKAVDEAEKQKRKNKMNKRLDKVLIVLAGAGGFYLGSR